MWIILLSVGRILIISLAVFGLTKLLKRKSSPPKGRIIEGEVIEENKEVVLK